MPSKEELNLMYNNLHVAGLGGFASTFYWSFTELNSVNEWLQNFFDGVQFNVLKALNGRLRAVRAF